jgi:hypothetical protein
MIAFLLRKFFYDLWDNLFRITALNFGFLISLSLAFVLPPLFTKLFPAGIILFCLLLFWLFVYLCAAAGALTKVSDYRSLSLKEFAGLLKPSLVPALPLFAGSGMVFFIIRFTIPVYLRSGTLAGTAAAFFCLWICLMLLGVLQFYPAVYHRLGKRPLKSLKKCFVIFFDNTAFSLFILALNLILMVLIIPCPGGPLLLLDEGLRLRLLKYDRPAAKTRRIPWGEILAEEKEKTGKRSWRDFIFPWKE